MLLGVQSSWAIDPQVCELQIMSSLGQKDIVG
jgi:hypothetical protein